MENVRSLTPSDLEKLAEEIVAFELDDGKWAIQRVLRILRTVRRDALEQVQAMVSSVPSHALAERIRKLIAAEGEGKKDAHGGEKP